MDNWGVSKKTAAHKLQEHWPSELCSGFDCEQNSPPWLSEPSFLFFFRYSMGTQRSSQGWFDSDVTTQPVVSVVQHSSCRLLQTFTVAADSKTTEVSTIFNWALGRIAKITLLLRNLGAVGRCFWLPQEDLCSPAPVRLFNKTRLWSKIDYLRLKDLLNLRNHNFPELI